MLKEALFPFKIINSVGKRLLDNYWLSKKVIENGSPDLLEKISKQKAFYIHKKALKNVSAYQKFVRGRKCSSIEDVPLTDKKNYVKKYSYESRCINNKFPKKGIIEESSGSSGKPTNWIREVGEAELLFKAAKFEFYYTFNADKKDYIVLSGWSSGPWATGLKFCELMEQYMLVKNTTADIDNNIRTLKQLGKKYNYLIAGYPPFLKNLFDNKNINWKQYKIDVITGGESTSLEWKKYIRKQLGNQNAKIISSYGASDIDIGIGFETPFSEFIRELTDKNQVLNKKLFGTNQNPILFQYNPLMHYIENTNSGEFSVTLLDPDVASPKVKYNLHDRGGSISYNEIIKVLNKYEKGKLKAFLKKNNTLKLPFLYVCGRKDGTISIGGNNIYPQQVEEAIHASKCAAKVNRFMIGTSHDNHFNVKFDVHVELKKGVKKSDLKPFLEKIILKKLLEENLEFKEYFRNHKSNQIYLKPKVSLYDFNKENMFKKQNKSIKQNYILKS
ncbi:MAG: phenylacetate--CoA ligase family protein [Nanoarchaeota archaeon]|nr:phenylacetate--CoA ligase family protein [Nanoarchaeota archaeon]